MYMGNELVLVCGKAAIKPLDDTSYRWEGPVNQGCTLKFRRAYALEELSPGNGIKDCVYQIHGRKFTDLSFLHGDTLEKYPDNYQIRKHEDGTKFLFSYTSIPTFDLEDRLWDGVAHTAVYCDDEGFNLLHSRHGASISKIEIYIGLIRSIPVFDEWLKLLRVK